MSEYERSQHEEILPRPMGEPRRGEVSGECRRSFFWPIMLIGFGVVMLLSNLGLFPAAGWSVLWRLWPLALIALGIDVLFGCRSTVGALLSGVLIFMLVGGAIGVAFFAQNLPALIQFTQETGYRHESAWYPVGGLETARITIDWTSTAGKLFALDDSANLIEAEIDYLGELYFDVTRQGTHAVVALNNRVSGVSFGNVGGRDARWEVGLSPLAALDLRLDTGSGAGSFDLTGLYITALELDIGSGAIDLTLPVGNFSGEIDGGSGALNIRVPAEVGLRVRLDDGSGSFYPGARLALASGDVSGDGVWETPGYATAEPRIELVINQASGAIRIQDN